MPPVSSHEGAGTGEDLKSQLFQRQIQRAFEEVSYAKRWHLLRFLLERNPVIKLAIVHFHGKSGKRHKFRVLPGAPISGKALGPFTS